MVDHDDLATLQFLDEHILNMQLEGRYLNDMIYTYVGDILVAVNPYQSLSIYGDNVARRYNKCVRSTLPPHVFAIADSMYTAAVQNDHSQVCVISGESGAGKTESTKLIVSHVLSLAVGSYAQLNDRILKMNPVLEAFGNSQTIMNQNSSRFGKFLEIRLDAKGLVSGAVLTDYLLEKSRVVKQDSSERNYHIFYYLLDGLPNDLKASYRLARAENYRYLAANNKTNPAKINSRKWDEIQEALMTMGFSGWPRDDMLTVLAAILHLGNISFDEDDDTEAALVANRDHLAFVASLLMVPVDPVESALVTRVNVVRGEEIYKQYNEEQAADARDSAAKALYGRLFKWLIANLNHVLLPDAAQGTGVSIGILDIFGFENFARNSFEQFCINWANEQLQFFFNEHIFRLELEEYHREGIAARNIKFVDNRPVLDLFCRRPIGLMSMLDEESKLASGNEDSLLKKLESNFRSSRDFSCLPNGFAIRHYAGRVIYESWGMIEKNRDPLPQLFVDVLASSGCRLVRTLFDDSAQLVVLKGAPAAATSGAGATPAAPSSSGPSRSRSGRSRSGLGAAFSRSFRRSRRTAPAPMGNSRPSNGPSRSRQGKKATVGGQFGKSLNELIAKMSPCAPHFVRCIKPNPQALPSDYRPPYVAQQLGYTGMLETVRIRREGFAHRLPFAEFVQRYHLLAAGALPPTADSCRHILGTARLAEWEIGKNKVFLKYWHVDELRSLLHAYTSKVIVVQKCLRGFKARRAFSKLLVQQRIEQQATVGFMQDLQGSHGCFVANMQTIADEDQRRAARQAQQEQLDREEALLPKGSVPEFGSRQHAKSVHKQQAQVKRWFEREELSRGAVAAKPPSPRPGRASRRSRRGRKSVRPTRQAQDAEMALWFRGMINRGQAEQLLHGRQSGTFLIRVSNRTKGYSISLNYHGRFKHYKIKTTADLHYLVVGTGRQFETLHALVEFYKEHSVSSQGDRMLFPCTPLESEASTESVYAELVWDPNALRKAKAKAHRDEGPEPTFAAAVAPMLQGDRLNVIDEQTIVEMEERYGRRQAYGRWNRTEAGDVESIAGIQAARSFGQLSDYNPAFGSSSSFGGGSFGGMAAPPPDYSRGPTPTFGEQPVIHAPVLFGGRGGRGSPTNSALSSLPRSGFSTPASSPGGSRAGSPLALPIPQLASPLPSPRTMPRDDVKPLVRTVSQTLRHREIIADAERRITLARQAWEKKNKKKKKRGKKKKKKRGKTGPLGGGADWPRTITPMAYNP